MILFECGSFVEKTAPCTPDGVRVAASRVLQTFDSYGVASPLASAS
jgi:hypothetical protein